MMLPTYQCSSGKHDQCPANRSAMPRTRCACSCHATGGNTPHPASPADPQTPTRQPIHA